MRSSDDRHLVCNVGTSRRISNNTILSLLSARFGELKVRHAPKRQGDVKITQANITCAEETLGYRPQYTFDCGLEETIEWVTTTPYMKTLKSRTG